MLFSGLSLETQFIINIFSLSGLPSTGGALAGFNPASDYAWSILSAANPISGFNPAHFTLNTSAFTAYNSLNSGLFSLEARDNELFLVYDGLGGTTVPEPGTWVAAILLTAAPRQHSPEGIPADLLLSRALCPADYLGRTLQNRFSRHRNDTALRTSAA